MRNGFLGSIAALAAGAGLAWGQGGGFPSGSYPVPVQQFAGPEIMPVVGGSPLLAPPVTVAPDPTLGAMSGPGYPPPSPFALNDPSIAEEGIEAPLRPAPRFFYNMEYLGWFITSQPINYPIITTSNAASQGRLFQPTTSVVYGTGDQPYNLISGFRLSGGMYWDADRRSGVDLSFFALQDRKKTASVFSDPAGNPTLAIPFINAFNGLQNSIVITAPNVANGGIIVTTSSQTWSGEINKTLNLYRSEPDCSWGASWTPYIGLRYLELEESFNLDTSSTLLTATNPPAFAAFPTGISAAGLAGSRNLSIHDNLRTFNQFYGGNLGARSEWSRGRWSLGINAKISAGLMHTTVDTIGSTTFARGTPTFTGSLRGGIYATPQGDGRQRQDKFAYIPEMTLNLGYSWSPRFSSFIGYNLIYVSDVVRVGDVRQPIVNPGVVPASPSFGLTPGVFPQLTQYPWSEFWMNGFQVGIAFKY